MTTCQHKFHVADCAWGRGQICQLCGIDARQYQEEIFSRLAKERLVVAFGPELAAALVAIRQGAGPYGLYCAAKFLLENTEWTVNDPRDDWGE